MATSFSDYSNPYITELYNQKKQAAADALTSAYQQNMATYDAKAQETTQNYANQRNQTQAQYEKALKNFGEYSNASGLNSGAQAQARIAYGNQNQSGLANLSAGEASALQDIARDRAGVESQYRSDLAANEAAYDTDLYNALYGAWQDQVSQDNADRAYYYTLAMDTLQTGNMPDANTLAKAGIDSGTAGSISAYYKALLTPATTSSGGGGSSRSSSGSSRSSSSGGSVSSGNGLSGLSGGSGNTTASSASTSPSASNLSMAAQYAAHLVGPTLNTTNTKKTTVKKSTSSGGGGKMLQAYR